MIKHVSVFTLKDKKEIEKMLEMLEEVSHCPLIIHSEVGANVTKHEGPGPHFGDIIQILTFKDQADLDAYPSTSEHMKLFLEGPEMETVTAIDYNID